MVRANLCPTNLTLCKDTLTGYTTIVEGIFGESVADTQCQPDWSEVWGQFGKLHMSAPIPPTTYNEKILSASQNEKIKDIGSGVFGQVELS
jgi:hypothetical protein